MIGFCGARLTSSATARANFAFTAWYMFQYSVRYSKCCTSMWQSGQSERFENPR